MIASAHVLGGFVSGLAAASAITNRAGRIVSAFALGVLSHVVLDAIPHADYAFLSRSTVRVVVVCEIVLATSLSWLIVRSRRPPGWRASLPMGLAGAMIPDVKFIAPVLLPAPAALWVQQTANRFHGLFHADRSPIAVGLTAEVLCTLLLLTSLTLFPRRHQAQRS
jgi:hypothetical protein